MRHIALSLCLAACIIGCEKKGNEKKGNETRLSSLAPFPAPPTGPLVVELYESKLYREEYEFFELYESKMYQEEFEHDLRGSFTPLDFIWSRLNEEVLFKEIELRGIAPDPEFVEKLLTGGIPFTTDEQYESIERSESFKQSEIIMNELIIEFRESGKDIDDYAAEVWEKREEELLQLRIASDAFSLGTTINKLLDQDLHIYEQLSQVEQLYNELTGELTLTPEEFSRGEEYFEKNKEELLANSEMTQSLYQNGDLEAILLNYKKRNFYDRWMAGKIKQDAIFHDSEIERDFLEWMDKNRPSYSEVFGPFDK